MTFKIYLIYIVMKNEKKLEAGVGLQGNLRGVIAQPCQVKS
jgi:hypothetical protein